KPTSSPTWPASSSVRATPEAGTASPIPVMAALKSSRSSAVRMASAEAPMSSTPPASSTPRSWRAMARFSAVWPPRVGRRASGRSRSGEWTRGRCAWASVADHQLPELFEEVAGVVGAGARLGVVLNAEGGHVSAGEALDDAVVEVDVGDVGVGHRPLGHRVVVVLAGDLD